METQSAVRIIQCCDGLAQIAMAAFHPLQTFARPLTSAPMPLEPLWTGSELLRKLLDDFLHGQLETKTFCGDVIVAYNEAIDDAALTPVEQSIFGALFNEVAWYSPFAEERRETPNYKSEEQIRAAAVRTADKLKSA